MTMSETDPNADPGYYYDPEQPDQLRRWDGSAWTEDRRPVTDDLVTTEQSPPAESALVVASGADPEAAAVAPLTTQRLASEDIVVSAPMSFAGSAARIWKLTQTTDDTPTRIALGTVAVIGIVLAWTLVLCWYLAFGLLLVPYRLVRRSSRKRKLAEAQHREMLDALSTRS